MTEVTVVEDPATEIAADPVEACQVCAARDAARAKALAASPLTERQIQVLALLAAGLTMQQTARGLGLTLSTVKTHARSIMHRTGAPNMTAAAVQGFRAGILN